MLLKAFLFALLVVLPTVAQVPLNVTNKCPQPESSKAYPPAFLYGHPETCEYFFTCAHGQPILMACPPGTVWNDVLQTCVGRRSYYDNCTKDRETPQPSCSGGSLLIPHPKICQRYFNCSQTERLSRHLTQFEAECPYPRLFDSLELKCKPFNETYCGNSRVVDKDACKYAMHMCGSAHCEECGSRLPSCIGLPDGDHPNPSRPGAPYYITCLSERLIRMQSCSVQPPSPTDSLSSPTRQCVTQWIVPDYS